MLHNKNGRGRRVPCGQAWQWIHDLDSLEHLGPILEWIDLRVSVDQLCLLNVNLDHTEITAPKNREIFSSCKSPIVYSRVTAADRVIHMKLMTCKNSMSH